MSEASGDGKDRLRGRLSDAVSFFVHFLKNPLALSSPFQSSRRVAEKVRDELSVRPAGRVVELGAGTGSLTRGILEALGAEGAVLCLERERAFCRRLRRRFGDRVEVVQGDALDVEAVISGTVWERPDAVVCSVPLVDGHADELCGAIANVLAPDGLYLQVANFSAPVKAHFTIERTYFFPMNLPPEHLHRAVPTERS